MYRIEFIGIPGVGKSTLMRMLVEKLRQQNNREYMTFEDAFHYVAKDKIDKGYRFILNALPRKIAERFISKIINRSLFQFDAQSRFLAHYGSAFQIVLASDEYNNMSHYDRGVVIANFLSLGSLYQAITEQIVDNAVIFNDEGFVQKSMMFTSYKTQDKELNESIISYFNNIPLPDLLIYVKADMSLCQERMFTRTKGLTARLKKLDKKARINFLLNSESLFEILVPWLQNERKVTVLQIDNSNSIDTTIKKLESVLLDKCSTDLYNQPDRRCQ